MQIPKPYLQTSRISRKSLKVCILNKGLESGKAGKQLQRKETLAGGVAGKLRERDLRVWKGESLIAGDLEHMEALSVGLLQENIQTDFGNAPASSL